MLPVLGSHYHKGDGRERVGTAKHHGGIVGRDRLQGCPKRTYIHDAISIDGIGFGGGQHIYIHAHI